MTRRARHIAAFLLLALFGFVLVRTAWVSDDAFIGLRSVVNLVQGDGFVWNVGERVQTYTAPLWTLSVAAVTFVIGDAWQATLALAFAASLLAFGLLVWKAAPSAWPAVFGGLTLVLSKAFTDYSTGGLENPFTHVFVLLGWFALASGDTADRRTLWRFAIVAGLATLNRLDTVLIFGPALAWLSWRVGPRRAIVPVIVGFLPVVAWEVFSILYYGFPFPNTAYAKAFAVGIERTDLLVQGKGYLEDSWDRDPITLCVIAGGSIASLCVGGEKRRAFVIGALLYVCYVVWIGGDYMSGRFLTAPLMVTVVAVTTMTLDWRVGRVAWPLATAASLVLGVLLVPCQPTFLSGPDFEECLGKIHGIADERGFYYGKGLGLLSPNRRDPAADLEGTPFKGQKLVVWNMMGYASYTAGRDVHMIDLFGLGDPILARLPNEEKVAPGHYRRAIPEGYLKTLESGENRITDPSLREFQDRLHLVQAGPIWSAERLETVLGFLLGRYDHLIEEYLARREKGPKQVDAATIGEPLPAGTPWHDPRTTTFDHDGLRIELGDVSHASSARIALDGDDQYAIAFVRGEALPQEPAVLPWDPQRRGIAHHVVPVPEAVRDAGFDAVLVLPTAGNNIFATGGLELLGDS